MCRYQWLTPWATLWPPHPGLNSTENSEESFLPLLYRLEEKGGGEEARNDSAQCGREDEPAGTVCGLARSVCAWADIANGQADMLFKPADSTSGRDVILWELPGTIKRHAVSKDELAGLVSGRAGLIHAPADTIDAGEDKVYEPADRPDEVADATVGHAALISPEKMK